MHVDGFLCSWMLNACMNCLCLYKYELSGFEWIRWIMNCDSYVLTWYEYAFGIGWFMELKWRVGMDLAWDKSEGWLMNMTWCRYETHFYFHGLRFVNERDWHGIQRRMELPRLAWDIYSCVLNNYLSWWWYGLWSVRNSLESLGGVFRVVLQWSGRNSMAPVSGCLWWCPICITW